MAFYRDCLAWEARANVSYRQALAAHACVSQNPNLKRLRGRDDITGYCEGHADPGLLVGKEFPFTIRDLVDVDPF